MYTHRKPDWHAIIDSIVISRGAAKDVESARGESIAAG